MLLRAVSCRDRRAWLYRVVTATPPVPLLYLARCTDCEFAAFSGRVTDASGVLSSPPPATLGWLRSLLSTSHWRPTDEQEAAVTAFLAHRPVGPFVLSASDEAAAFLGRNDQAVAEWHRAAYVSVDRKVDMLAKALPCVAPDATLLSCAACGIRPLGHKPEFVEYLFTEPSSLPETASAHQRAAAGAHVLPSSFRLLPPPDPVALASAIAGAASDKLRNKLRSCHAHAEKLRRLWPRTAVRSLRAALPVLLALALRVGISLPCRLRVILCSCTLLCCCTLLQNPRASTPSTGSAR